MFVFSDISSSPLQFKSAISMEHAAAVMIDNGSEMCKVGCKQRFFIYTEIGLNAFLVAGDEAPRAVFP